MIRAAFFDFGGVILSSPFEAFNRYEAANGLPHDLIRRANSMNSDSNAWALFERGTLTPAGFAARFELEIRELGCEVDGLEILKLIEGELRPGMVDVLKRVRACGFGVACLTNNFRSLDSAAPEIVEVLKIFDQVIESSRIGVRKPDPAFYHHALSLMEVEANEVVFLDDLGINLKPARAMGMTTIKVVNEQQAVAELGRVLGLDLSDI